MYFYNPKNIGRMPKTFSAPTLIKIDGIFIAAGGKTVCPACKGEGKIKNRFGIRTCYICMSKGEITEVEAEKFQKAFAEYMRKLEGKEN